LQKKKKPLELQHQWNIIINPYRYFNMCRYYIYRERERVT